MGMGYGGGGFGGGGMMGQNRDAGWGKRGADVPVKRMKKRMFTYEDQLKIYELPDVSGPISSVKFLLRETHELDARPIPATMFTLINDSCGRRTVQLWVESLNDPDLSFTCVRSITPVASPQKTRIFDAEFIYLPSAQPRDQISCPVLPWHTSKLFNTKRDKVLQLKKRQLRPEDDPLGMCYPNVPETSVDWIAIMNDNTIEVYKCSGLKNFPIIEGHSVSLFKVVQTSSNSSDLLTLRAHSFVSPPVCLKFDDHPIFICANRFGQFLRFSVGLGQNSKGQVARGSTVQQQAVKVQSRLDTTRVFPLAVAR